jgi:hypothetical protein
MEQTSSEILKGWREFYLLMGTAAATLVGLMFVVASIGAGLFTDAHKDMMKAFITPTVIHFCVVLFVCLAALAPSLTSVALAIVAAAAVLIGIGYSCTAEVRILKRYVSTTTLGDRLWYAPIPIVGYLILAAAALSQLVHASLPDVEWIAFALCIILAAGVRNAWAITLWVAVQPRNG